MKRIYMIGAALILFLLIGGGYYYNASRQAPGAQSTVIDKNAFPAVPATTPTDKATVVPATAIENTDNYVAVNAIRRGKKRSYKTKHPYFIDHAQAQQSASAPLAQYVSDNEVAAETSNDYFATTPAKTTPKSKKVVRIRPANNSAVYGMHRGFSRNFGIGVEVGFNQNGLTNSPASNILTGSVHAGIITNFRLGDNLAFQPALLYINKGTKSMNETDVNSNEKLAMHYLQLPADLVYKFGNPDNARIMVGAGPYISYLLSARDKFVTNTDNNGFSDVIGGDKPTYNAADIKKLDWGLDGFIGCETPEGLFAKAGAQLGLRNIDQNPVAGNAVRNYSFFFSIGYIMSGNRK